MYYSDDQLKQLKADYQTVDGKLKNLFESYVSRKFKDTRAQEFATQGFPRRLKIMVRCIDNVFEIVPPDRVELPTRGELSDATINIQAFVFNVFGSIDNLAWIWVSEKGQKRKDGTPIPNKQIGLWKDNESVRSTLSEEFQNYLKRLDCWLDHIGSLRHALAHRIPLYIPPYVIADKDAPAYGDFQMKMIEAAKRGDIVEYDRLSEEQLKLAKFRPWIQHSFEEKAIPIVFHAQMLADFNTVEELGRKMLEELSR